MLELALERAHAASVVLEDRIEPSSKLLLADELEPWREQHPWVSGGLVTERAPPLRRRRDHHQRDELFDPAYPHLVHGLVRPRDVRGVGVIHVRRPAPRKLEP